MKWIVALALILALPFALGLRIDLKVFQDTYIHKKEDPNAAALRKMGIDPTQVGQKAKPWWTFKKEDSLFKTLQKWDPVGKMSDESWKASQTMQANMSGNVHSADRVEQARAVEAQARLRETVQRLDAGK